MALLITAPVRVPWAVDRDMAVLGEEIADLDLRRGDLRETRL
ncbi:hypothetical protein V6U90_17060 [Micromonospora sp. CPCC 206060]